MSGVTKINIAGSMVVEDHLKRTLSKTGGKPFKQSDNKLLPRPQESPFGDFPASHKNKPAGTIAQPQPLAAQEASVAATKVGKCSHSRL